MYFVEKFCCHSLYYIGCHAVSCHLIELSFGDSDIDQRLVLIVGEALKSEAFDWHQSPDKTVVGHAVFVLGSKSEHRFIGFFDPSPLLANGFPFGCDDGSGSDNARMLTLMVGDACILPCSNTSCFMRHFGIGIHVDEV